MTTDSQKTISKSVSSFFFGTLLSRITGLFRDIALAFFFGSGPFISAFMVAYRLANLFRRIFGETSLQAGFVPHFESIKSSEPGKAAIFYRDLFFTMFFVLSLVVLGCEGLLLAFNSFNFSPEFKQIIVLTELMLPGLIFICLYSLNSSLLQCEKKYFLPSVAPALFNVIWILAAYLFRKVEPAEAVTNLAIATLFAFFVQWAFTSFPSLSFFSFHLSSKEFLKPKIFSENLRAMIKPMSMGVIGVSSIQINTALDAFFARAADLSGPAYLWYAMRIHQLPLALFGIALSGAILPPLSRAFDRKDLISYKNFIYFSLKKASAFMLSATFGIIALGGASINLLFGRGEFDEVSIYNTLLCLWAYGLGLVFTTFALILSNAFYAQKNYLLPTKISVYSVILNVLLNTIFVFAFDLKSVSIALATSLAALFNFVLLLINFKEEIFDKKLLSSIFKILSCNGIALLSVLLAGHFIFHDPTLSILQNKGAHYPFPRSFFEQLSTFSVLSFTYFAVLIISAYLSKSGEILEIVRIKKVSDF